MTDIQEVAAQVNEFVSKRSARHSAAAKYLQGVLAASAAIVAMCHFADFGEKTPLSHTIGFFLSIFVGISAVFLIFFNGDPDEALELARQATETARNREVVLKEELSRLDRSVAETAEHILRANDLYSALSDMQRVVYGSIENPSTDEIATVKLLLELAPSLKNATGFSGRGHWTIGVYKAEVRLPPERTILRCIAHERSSKCDIARARAWPEGVGVAGAAYASGEVIEVPDLAAVAAGNRYSGATSSGLVRPDDEQKYRSVVAIPVAGVDLPGSRPWGVVVASSDRPGHFNSSAGRGVHPLQAMLALANMVELVIKVKLKPANGSGSLNVTGGS